MKLTLAFDIYNKEKWIASLLDSWLSNLSGKNKYEFIVVFDGLKDESRKIADKKFREYKYLYLSLFAENKYEIFCNNLALQHATGDYIIFIQDDNWIYDKNWDSTLTEVIAKIPNLGVISFLSGLRVFAPPIRWERIEADRPHKRKYFEIQEIESCDTAIWQVDAINRPFCINKELLNSLGGLDRAYEPTYGDDFDLSLKLLRKGKTNIYIPFDLVNIGGFKKTLNKKFFAQAKQEARKLWQARYGHWLEERTENNVHKLKDFKCLRKHAHGIRKLCLGVQKNMKSIGWYSIDIRGHPDRKEDAEKLKGVRDNSCEAILASSVLEHFNYQGHGSQRIKKTIMVLQVWKRKLRPNGRLYICVPDGDVIVETFIKYRNRYWDIYDTPCKDIIGSIYGKGTRMPTYHRMIYNFFALKHCLEQAGFKDIKKLDDSLASDEKFLVHFNPSASDHGRILRVEARKPK